MSYSVMSKDAMRELNVLSSSNLGVLSKNSNAYLREDSRVLIIGLGGMGQETVCRLKKTLTKNIGTLDENRIQFLILDTAANELTDRFSEGEVAADEFIKLHTNTLESMFENLYCKGEMSNLLLKHSDSRIIRSKIKRHSQAKGGCPASNHRYVHGHHPPMYISKIKWTSILPCSIILNHNIA